MGTQIWFQTTMIQDFFQTFEILVSQESSYFFITDVKFYGWTMFRLEDIEENVPDYGNHLLHKSQSWRYIQTAWPSDHFNSNFESKF